MPKVLKRARQLVRQRRYSRRTELAYVCWMKRFIHFHGLHHPADIGCPAYQEPGMSRNT